MSDVAQRRAAPTFDVDVGQRDGGAPLGVARAAVAVAVVVVVAERGRAVVRRRATRLWLDVDDVKQPARIADCASRRCRDARRRRTNSRWRSLCRRSPSRSCARQTTAPRCAARFNETRTRADRDAPTLVVVKVDPARGVRTETELGRVGQVRRRQLELLAVTGANRFEQARRQNHASC